MSTDRQEPSRKRKPYARPAVRTFGAVRRLTHGGSVGAKENSAADKSTMA